ncbi:Exonuclease RNase T and DNA polymerase III [Alicyclobacillus hesperidum URH17-3-68]|uniref:ATP-dependent DNA helicase DinG n=1 Tax=Alicyclobacillus hesperidum TaxID=89784 RepID=UPI0002819C24|nr:ATP-dependent DNA helicase DinG [Alicyclobacillus hesperidum]EJY55049.1 Exonuclease RNase T and DNA polymerase III [Alicyclobacillus hesperidum URH17-3-68]
MDYVVVDIETTGLDPVVDDIVEIGAVRLVDGEIVDRYQTFVRPSRPIPPDIEELTGISMAMVEQAPGLTDVIPALLAFMGEMPMVAHNLAFDRAFLQRKCEQAGYSLASGDGICTLNLGRVLAPRLHSHRLEYLTRRLAIAQTSAHRALADAEATAKLFVRMAEKAQKLPISVLERLTQMAALYSPATAEWFQAVMQSVKTNAASEHDNIVERDGLAFTRPSAEGNTNLRVPSSPLEALRVEEIADRARALLGPGGLLSQILDGYEPRKGQLEMLEKVSQALAEGKHALVEAGTGTGKSMAYLVPAAMYAVTRGEPVVVSTHTIALQDQIERRDFPTLQRLFGGTLRLAVQKGRRNYVCLRKVRTESSLVTFVSPQNEIESLMSLLVWLTETKDGTRENLSASSVPSNIWARVQSETESCINKRCPFFHPCYYFRAKTAAQDAHVVVTNHSLLMSDLKADHRVLPKYSALVVDEAHHLEEQATSHLGSEVHSAQLAAFAHRLTRDRGKHGVLPELANRLAESHTTPLGIVEKLQLASEWVEVVQQAVDAAFAQVGSLVPEGKSEFRLTAEWLETDAYRGFVRALEEAEVPLVGLERLRQTLQELAKGAATDDEAGRIVDAAGFLGTWLDSVRLLASTVEELPGMVTWVERRGTMRPRWSVHKAPIDVAETLQKALFDPLDRVILTSATLSVRGSFDYVTRQLGLTAAASAGNLLSASVASPFHYGTQARLCVPSDVPELAKMAAEEAALWLGDSLLQLARVSRGRLLALFTSHQMLKETAHVLRHPLRQAGMQLFAQDVDGSRASILEAFRNQPESVMFGAQSFWEGIDLPGDQLTTLVIVRLPFAPPTHPVTQARHEKIEQTGGSPFWASSLPEAVVRFRQGFGRLIRTRQDKGVVVVYDKRLVTQRYGSAFVQSLPGIRPIVAPERDILAQIEAFLGSSSATDKHIRSARQSS